MESNTVAARRINKIATHISPLPNTETGIDVTTCARETVKKLSYDPSLRWNGYGYADTAFYLNKEGVLEFKGPKYELHGHAMPNFRAWAESEAGFSPRDVTPSQSFVTGVTAPVPHPGFLSAVSEHCIRLTQDDQERVFHSHGHTVEEVYQLRHGSVGRIPDVIIYPGSHAHVEKIVQLANEHRVVIIPFGGGTSVTNGITCPPEEKRFIVSLDMREMKKIKWLDADNMLACIEAGASGEYIEEQLRPKGFCFGHEPDSYEFSTLGGWISTRASGMKKNVYGNIEDLLISCKMVTSIGVLEQKSMVPRLSSGPDMNEITIGTEGNFGVITEAIVKIRRIPECQTFGAIAFPTFQAGFECMRDLAQLRCFPASIRLMDNEQFRLASALKTAQGPWTNFVDAVKKFYVTTVKGFDVHNLCAATLVFEGQKDFVKAQEKLVYELAAKHGGLKSDEESGRRGYTLTYMIAYIRDVIMDYSFLAESFETSMPFTNALQLCDAVKKRIKDACLTVGVKKPPFVCCRITQIYDNGCAAYFYFAIHYKGLADPVQAYLEIEKEAREEILKQGGSISHHHGIGKLRAHFMAQTMSVPAIKALKAMKAELDPNDVFAARNMGM